ncbi:E3 ubiquitin-protein ligase listerin [Sergentomyia squamirostris]
MGGKTKQAQRTKNNARPSSSGRSAEFLGSSVPAFVGFTAVENCGFVPVVPGFATSEAITEEIDANVDANYQLIMRKMSKKDPITKSKALQEFCDLVTSSDVDLVKTILPFWPRLYINLATDVEHRVREGAQQAHGTLSAKAGKFLAPFLRQIAPVWITSQYDSYAPAASLAIASFQRSFPPHKLKEVFSFCQNEFLDYITKILTVHTATTLSNSKSYTSEECEAKYQRTVSCCLQGYAQYLRTVNDENLNEVTNNNITLIEHQKFWNFHKHKSPNIRSAWFEAVSMVVQKIPHLLEKHTAQVVNAAFQNLDENDPIVLPHLWQAVLLIQVNLPTWSKHVNWEKMLLPKLWKVLKNGSSVTYPHLLPFISRINIEILENEEKLLKFYGNFFENFSEGLRNRHGSLTKWELNTLITSYFECVQFVIMQLLKEASTTSSYRDFSDKLLSDHVLDTIFWCMTVGFHCGKCVYGKIATLMTSWSQNSTSNDEYKALTENFWAKMFPVIERSVEIVGKDLNSKTESHVNFCHCLKYSMTHRLLKNNKVKFEPAAEEHAPSTEKSTPKPVYEDQLQDLVLKICRMYLRSIIELRNPTFIPKLQNLFAEFGCFQLYSDLTEDGDLSGLLSRFELMLADGKLRQEFIVDMIIKLYDHFPDDKKREILKNLIENPHRIVCNWIITRILSHPLCTEPGISEILSQEKVKKHLVDQAAVASQSTTLESFNLLHKCFFQTESGEILIDNDTCSEIIDKIATSLNASQDKLVLDSCGSFLAQVMPVICEDASKASIQKQMFITLFRFTVNQSDVPPEGDDQHVWEIMTSWQDSLSIGDLHLTDSLAETCCQIIGGKLHEIPTDCVEHLAEVASKLILCSSEGLPKDSEIPEFIDKMIDNVLNLNMGQYRKHQSFAKHLSLHIQAINQKLTTLEMSPDEEIQSMDHDSSLKMFFQASLFKILVITKLCCKIKRARKEKTSDVDDPEVEEEEDTDDFCDSEANQLVKSSKEIHSQILEGFFALACGETFLLHGSLLNPEVEEKIHQLGASVEVMLKNCPEELRVTLKEKLFQKANQEGGIWANSLTILKNCPEYEGDNGPVLLYEDAASTLEDSETLLTYVNILQSLTPSIPPKCLPVVPNLFENLTNMMISTASNRCLVTNNFSGDFNDFEDRKIMGNCLKILTAAATRIKSKDLHSLYNINLKDLSTSDVIFTVELANFIGQLLLNFSAELEDAHWDFIRIALSSWVLTASKSVENYVDSNIAIFLASVFKLFAAMESFVIAEKTKSSTDRLTKIVEEWEHVFAQDGHLVLLRVFMYIVQDTKATKLNKGVKFSLKAVC